MKSLPPVELEFPDVELDANLPLVAGANTVGLQHVPCCRFWTAKGKKVVWQSKEWATEPNRSNSAATEKLGGGGGRRSMSVQGVMRPTRPGTPEHGGCDSSGDGSG